MRIAIAYLICFLLLISSYFYGYYRGEIKVQIELFDKSLMSISSNIVIRDAINNNLVEETKPLVVARIEADILTIVQLYNKHHFAISEIGRCAITRRVRKLAKQNEVFIDKKTLAENGYPIDEVISYLDKECLGEPSKESWVSGINLGRKTH